LAAVLDEPAVEPTEEPHRSLLLEEDEWAASTMKRKAKSERKSTKLP